jgi:hypothetical protein
MSRRTAFRGLSYTAWKCLRLFEMAMAMGMEMEMEMEMEWCASSALVSGRGVRHLGR